MIWYRGRRALVQRRLFVDGGEETCNTGNGFDTQVSMWTRSEMWEMRVYDMIVPRVCCGATLLGHHNYFHEIQRQMHEVVN